MAGVVGPDFLAIQVRDLQRASEFYELQVGLDRESNPPPGMVVFKTETIPFAVREPLLDTDLDAGPVGVGVMISLTVRDAQALHDALSSTGTAILMAPFDTPFGRTFVFEDPDGDQVAIHGAV